LHPDEIRAAARAVLQLNDLGDWTRPAPRLYPHQWSWDSAFIAIGLATFDPRRAVRELETLFAAQWADGRVPHIVFNPAAADYFPGPDLWDSVRTSQLAPRDRATSGLVQPPVHGLALERIYRAATARGLSDVVERIAALLPKLLAWHRYLATARDPSDSGLLLIYHPWESGTDNSPRWDAALARVTVGALPEYQRHDLKHVEDPAQRPTRHEYDQYLWLVELLKRAAYDDASVQQSHPFQIRDEFMSAIFAAASSALANVVAELNPSAADDVAALRQWSARSTSALERAYDKTVRLALDIDTIAGEPVHVVTCAGLAPLIAPALPAPLVDSLVERLFDADFAGAPDFAFRVVPSTAPGSIGFQPRAYWRGPTWPIANWLLWWALRQHGRHAAAATLRQANLDLLARPEARFAEYFNPYTAGPLGSVDQSWTAAVALDWLEPESAPSALR
jgi:hypothetical protein